MREADQRAAIFVDYENLHAVLRDQLEPGEQAELIISEIIDALRHAPAEHEPTRPALILAFADFSRLQTNGHDLQRTLYFQGTDPRFVPASLQPGAAEMQLCIEVVETLHNRPDIQSFTLLTGNRAYLPLVQHLRRHGRSVRVVAVEHPPAADLFPSEEEAAFVDALSLLGERTRRTLLGTRRSGSSNGQAAPSSRGENAAAPYRRVSGGVTRHTLEIIEEFFGQYEEVYLTPLLRKLSEVFDEDAYDPKATISELEEAGAVWLEKRRGFPYDYTVLLVNAEHPDVVLVRRLLAENGRAPSEPAKDHGEDYYIDEYDDPEEGPPDSRDAG